MAQDSDLRVSREWLERRQAYTKRRLIRMAFRLTDNAVNAVYGGGMKDYFRYFADSPRAVLWGCEVTAAGHTRVPAGANYPPARHPDDHHFQWERGRVLRSFQLVFISEGKGVLEHGRPGQANPLRAGDVFLLFPGIWHRFSPDAETGWVEHWIECRGPMLDRLLAAEQLSPTRPVSPLAHVSEVYGLFLRMHELILASAPSSRDGAATLAMHLLSRVAVRDADEDSPGASLAERLEKARQLILERSDRPLRVTEIARAVGLGHSRFRQVFARECGTGAREFHAEARLRRACDLLANTELSVKQVAELLGFSSAFHFCHAFKRRLGVPPSRWKTKRDA
jgi:AraC-like DNA-binding protein